MKNEGCIPEPCLTTKRGVFLAQTIQHQIVLLFVHGQWSEMGQTLTETNKTKPRETPWEQT